MMWNLLHASGTHPGALQRVAHSLVVEPDVICPMTEPAPGELDLFERFKEFLGGCTWAVMIARASAETRSQIAPGKIEQWMRRWLSSSDPQDIALPRDSFI